MSNSASLSASEQSNAAEYNDAGNRILKWVGIAVLIYLVILAVGTIGDGFKWATGGKDGATQLFEFATNPFLGLLIGTLATALIQSSSTVTSIIVGLVAGGLPVATAIPMVMGANIGTTITNTLVSLGHVREKEEFRRAFAAATVHDIFNLIAVVIFLPLEIAFGVLEYLSQAVATVLVGSGSMSIGAFNFIKPITKPIIDFFEAQLAFLPEPFGGIALIAIGILMIFGSIMFIGKLLKSIMVGRAKAILHAAIGRGPVSGILSGTAVTMLVQSSSTTTSLAVPLAGSGVFGLREIYPFTLGANIGTTITALLASTAVVGVNAVFALEIALVHFFYNLLGVIIVYGIPFLRVIPVRGAQRLADVAAERKSMALAYIVSIFFLIPGAFVGISTML